MRTLKIEKISSIVQNCRSGSQDETRKIILFEFFFSFIFDNQKGNIGNIDVWMKNKMFFYCFEKKSFNLHDRSVISFSIRSNETHRSKTNQFARKAIGDLLCSSSISYRTID